jgi:RND family efflux transporter MFP subunit
MRKAWLIAAVLLLAACSRGKDADPVPAGTLVSTTEAVAQDVPVLLRALGQLQSRVSPQVSAEVDGRIIRLVVDEGDELQAGDLIAELDAEALRLEHSATQAEATRVEALLANSERRVKRAADLHAKGFVARETLDDAEAERAVLAAQARTAKARRAIIADQLARTRILAPLAGRVEKRLVSAGDFVRRGTPVVELATSGQLRALLPFPEDGSQRLKPGLRVTLRSPIDPGREATGQVSELRPAVGEFDRAVWAIVDFANPGGWRPGATVFGELEIERHAGAVVVPSTSLVRRPAGEVVYVIEGDRAVQRVVRVGERFEGRVEVLEGVRAGEAVAVEGAAYLSDGAPVRYAGARP